MNIKQILQQSAKKLTNKKILSPVLDSELLLMHVLKKDKEYLYSYPKKILSQTQIERFNKLLKQRLDFKPIAYILGYKYFYNLRFFVNSTVLIPRPDTEILVEQALKIINNKKNKIKTIADIGTGSGAIAVALAKNIDPKIEIFGTDICKRALNIAAKNAKLHNVKVDLKFGNLLEPIKNQKLDLIVANLPYLKPTDEKKLVKRPESRAIQFEPKKALYGGAKGLQIYKEFLRQISELKHKPKLIIIEYGEEQTKQLKQIIKNHLTNVSIKVFKDYCDLDRVIKISF